MSMSVVNRHYQVLDDDIRASRLTAKFDLVTPHQHTCVLIRKAP